MYKNNNNKLCTISIYYLMEALKVLNWQGKKIHKNIFVKSRHSQKKIVIAATVALPFWIEEAEKLLECFFCRV